MLAVISFVGCWYVVVRFASLQKSCHLQIFQDVWINTFPGFGNCAGCLRSYILQRWQLLFQFLEFFSGQPVRTLFRKKALQDFSTPTFSHFPMHFWLNTLLQLRDACPNRAAKVMCCKRAPRSSTCCSKCCRRRARRGRISKSCTWRVPALKNITFHTFHGFQPNLWVCICGDMPPSGKRIRGSWVASWPYQIISAGELLALLQQNSDRSQRPSGLPIFERW